MVVSVIMETFCQVFYNKAKENLMYHGKAAPKEDQDHMFDKQE